MVARITLICGLVLFSIAVGIGHLVGSTTDPLSTTGSLAPSGVLQYVESLEPNIARFLDLSSGAQVFVKLPIGDRLDQIACTPWRDREGRAWMAGRWHGVLEQKNSATQSEYGLALYRVPDGECLARVRSETLPAASPCWIPGFSARIVFAAGDRRLYWFDFDSLNDQSGLLSRAPERIEWRPGTWPEGEPMVFETHSPTAASTEDLVLVSLMPWSSEKNRYLPAQIWWIRLDRAGTRIAKTGRLLAPNLSPDGNESEERRPILSQTPTGELVLLYQARAREGMPWQTRAVPVRFNASTDSLRVGDGIILDKDLRISVQALSSDCRWVYTIVRDYGQPARVRRLPMAETWLAGNQTSALDIH